MPLYACVHIQRFLFFLILMERVLPKASKVFFLLGALRPSFCLIALNLFFFWFVCM